MSLSTKPYWLACLLVAQSVAAAERRAMTEEEALELLEKSPAQLSLSFEIDRARATASGAGLWHNPEVFFSRENSLGTTDEFFTVGQTLPLNGRLGLEQKAAEATAEAGSVRARFQMAALRARTRVAFAELLFSQQASSELLEARDRMAELVSILRAREDEGESSGYDRMRAEREHADVEVDHLAAKRTELRARLALTSLLDLSEGIEIDAVGRLDERRALPPLKDALSRAETRGDVEAYGREMESAELRGRAASRLRIPEPTFVAGTKRTDTGRLGDRGTTFSLTVPIPTFRRGRQAGVLARTEAALARARHEAQLRIARAEIEAAYEETVSLREAEEVYGSSADLEELLGAARLAYEEGEQGILELLDAYRAVLAVKLRGLELAAEARKARIALDRAAGEEVH